MLLSPAERSGMMQHDLFTEWANKFVRRNDNEAGVDALKKRVRREGRGRLVDRSLSRSLVLDRTAQSDRGARTAQLATIGAHATPPAPLKSWGNVESIEPLTTNFFSRRVRSGEFAVGEPVLGGRLGTTRSVEREDATTHNSGPRVGAEH